MKPSEYFDEKNFSLVLGGPFFQLLRRAHLTGNALELVKLRVIIMSMFAWFPLLLLSMLDGQLWGAGLRMSFLQDIDVHIRFLITLPLLIVAELLVHQRLLSVVRQFQERNLIPETALGQFHKTVSSALRLRNSVIAEAVMLAVTYVIGYQIIWHQSTAILPSAWYSQPAVAGSKLSWAGVWFRYVSLPLFQFLMLRWYYRIFIWTRFLFQVSRIKLKLVSTHPDEVGGLGFLTGSVSAFMPLAVAHGAILAGMISNHIFYQGAKLLDFKIEVIIIVVLVLCLVILPLISFSPQLADAKRLSSLVYGKFASRYVEAFETNWVNGKAPVDSSIMGADIQSLADLSNSYKVVENMRMIPVTRNAIVSLVIITVAPVLPLVLTMMPMSELIKMLAGMIF